MYPIRIKKAIVCFLVLAALVVGLWPVFGTKMVLAAPRNAKAIPITDGFDLPSDYHWTFKMLGETTAAPFGCDDLDLWQYRHDGDQHGDTHDVAGDWTGYEMTSVRLTSDAQKGTAGIRYSNVGTYRGEPVDMKVTLVDWDGFFISDNGLMFEREYPTVAFSKNFIGGVGISCVTNPVFEFAFFKNRTDIPITIKGYGTLRDLDGENDPRLGGQEFRISDNVEAAYYMANGNIRDAGDYLYGTVVCDPMDKNSMASLQYNASSFRVAFNCPPRANDGYGNIIPVNGEGYFDFAPEFLTDEPSTPTASIKKEVDKDWIYKEDGFNYTLNVSTLEGEFHSFVISDTLEDCLQTNGKITVKEGTKDVSGEFTIQTSGQNISLTAKNPGLCGKSDRTFTVTIPVKVKAGHDLSGYLSKDKKTYVLPNKAHLSYTDFYDTQVDKDSNEVKTVLYRPSLKIQKDVSKYDWKVGDKVEYTVAVTQTVKNAKAYNVVVEDNSLPTSLQVEGKDGIEVTGVTGASLQKSGNGWKVTVPVMGYNDKVTIKFQATVKEAANGTEIVNTAVAKADNADPVQDVQEVYVNSPALSIDKSVDHYEWRVGEEVAYQVVVKNTKAGSIARSVVISDLSLPDGLAPKGEDAVSVTGIPDKITVPIKGDKTVHKETKEEKVTSSLTREKSGWNLKISALPADTPVTISFACVATDKVNGMEVINHAVAEADDVPEVEDTEKVWINAPKLKIVKTADQEKVKVGDIITYSLKVTQEQKGAVARNVVISDTMETKGVKLQKNSIVLLDSDGKKIEDADISVKGEDFVIKTNRNLVKEGKYSLYDKEDGGIKEMEQWNPLGLKKETSFTVEYQAMVQDEDLTGTEVRNVAVADSDEKIPDEDEETVVVKGPNLDIEKTSDKAVYEVGETGRYELTIRNTREDAVAKDVIVTDALQREGAVIQKDSIAVTWNGEKIKPKSVSCDGKTFVIETGKDISDEDKLKVSYDVLFESASLAGEDITNVAVTWGSNTPERKDDNTVTIKEEQPPAEPEEPKPPVIPESPNLEITKFADQSVYHVGDVIHYTIVARQTKEGLTAQNVRIKDIGLTEGVVLDPKTIKVLDKEKKERADAQITVEGNTFTVVLPSLTDEVTVTFDAAITEPSLSGKSVSNTAVITADGVPERETSVVVPVPDDTIGKATADEGGSSGIHTSGRSGRLGIVKTGDAAPIILFSVLLLVSLTVIVAGIIKWRKGKKKDE